MFLDVEPFIFILVSSFPLCSVIALLYPLSYLFLCSPSHLFVQVSGCIHPCILPYLYGQAVVVFINVSLFYLFMLPVHFISKRQHIIFTTLFIFNHYGQLTYYSSHNADAFSF